jgi:hypothetical protein
VCYLSPSTYDYFDLVSIFEPFVCLILQSELVVQGYSLVHHVQSWRKVILNSFTLKNTVKNNISFDNFTQSSWFKHHRNSWQRGDDYRYHTRCLSAMCNH